MYQLELVNTLHHGGNYCQPVDRVCIFRLRPRNGFLYSDRCHGDRPNTTHNSPPQPPNFPSITQPIPLPASPATIRAAINIKYSIFGKPRKA